MTPLSFPLDQEQARLLRATYPDCDGNPMSESMTQGRWIHFLYGNLRYLFAYHDDVLIAMDNLWYPVEGRPDLRQAPDGYVVFGRPRGDRGSYMQWLENNVPLTVVFEILPPVKRAEEMIAKHLFYDLHGVEEYYVYDPHVNTLEVHVRYNGALRSVHPVDGHVSKRLGIRFQMTTPEMTIIGPEGKLFHTPEQFRIETDAANPQATPNQQIKAANQRIEAANQQTKAFNQQAKAATLLAARLIELGRKARRGQASVEELTELDRLEEECARRS